MANVIKHYLMVSMDVVPEGFSIQAWISVEKPHPIDLIQFPHTYIYLGEGCTWVLNSSCELTAKVVSMCGEQADRICIAGEKSARNRLAVNR